MSKDIIEILKEKFPEQEFAYSKDSYGGYINTFYIKSKNEELLSNTWEPIRNMIGVYFQSKLESEFDMWNIYLFYIQPSVIKRELKHLIEHDTISSRKIVIDDGIEQSKEFLISEHITNTNLNINIDEKNKIKFSKNKIISDIIDKIDISKIKKNTEDSTVSALEQIEKSLEDEI
jgi:hypothetical protein